MSQRLGKLNRRKRIELVKSWKVTTFPAALLIHGPPPSMHNYESHREYGDARRDYLKMVRDWYFDNFLSQYRKPTAMITNMRHRFIDDFEKWWDKEREKQQ